MKLKSKIRSIFSNDLLDLIASICDTKRVASLPEKMKILRDLLYSNGIKFEVLGGATNRIALFIDGYAVKFAMDNQGYRDNLIEYSICEELQPYVTKAYETNGYVLIAECVRPLTESDFIVRKQDMLNILMNLSNDYLLGDVGYIRKNMTNWGIRDNGDVVILDYAYCHRATEMLFTCPVCGEGVLTYDHVFDKLMCTNKSVCHATFTYNQRKSAQGDQVDLDMIEERKKESLILNEDEDAAIIEGETQGRLINQNGHKVIVVNNDATYRKMMEARKMISTKFDSDKAMELLVKLALTSDKDQAARDAVIKDLENLEATDTNTEYQVSDEYQSELIGREYDEDSGDKDDDEPEYTMENLFEMIFRNESNNSKSADFKDEPDYTDDPGAVQMPASGDVNVGALLGYDEPVEPKCATAEILDCGNNESQDKFLDDYSPVNENVPSHGGTTNDDASTEDTVVEVAVQSDEKNKINVVPKNDDTYSKDIGTPLGVVLDGVTI